MPIDPDVLRGLVAAGEDDKVAFMPKLPDESSVARALAGFANAEGGTLIVGASHDGRLESLSDQDVDRAVDLLQGVAGSLLPQLVDIQVAMLANYRVVVAAVAPASETARPVLTARGELVVRAGSAFVEPPPDILAGPSEMPYRGRIARPDGVIRLFVAMSFHVEQEPALIDYYDAMQRAAAASEWKIDMIRIDLLPGDYDISQRLMTEIDKANIVLADFTRLSSNVFFELGYARGRGKPVIQTARRDTPLPFDLRNWRTLFYRNARELEHGLLLELPEVCKGLFEA